MKRDQGSLHLITIMFWGEYTFRVFSPILSFHKSQSTVVLNCNLNKGILQTSSLFREGKEKPEAQCIVTVICFATQGLKPHSFTSILPLVPDILRNISSISGKASHFYITIALN